MFGKIIAVILIGGLIAFSTWQIVNIVRTIRDKKKSKIDIKENDEE